MFVEADSDSQDCVARIATDYPEFVPKTAPDGVWADPWVIGLAFARDYIVISQERHANPGEKRLHIPDVCDRLSVPRCNFLEFLRQEGWKF